MIFPSFDLNCKDFLYSFDFQLEGALWGRRQSTIILYILVLCQGWVYCRKVGHARMRQWRCLFGTTQFECFPSICYVTFKKSLNPWDNIWPERMSVTSSVKPNPHKKNIIQHPLWSLRKTAPKEFSEPHKKLSCITNKSEKSNRHKSLSGEDTAPHCRTAAGTIELITRVCREVLSASFWLLI